MSGSRPLSGARSVCAMGRAGAGDREAGASAALLGAGVGRQALSHYVLDHPAQFADKRVLDIGAGCGQYAIATGKSGAHQVTATDLDPSAIAAMKLNADLNGVGIEIIEHDFFGMVAP